MRRSDSGEGYGKAIFALAIVAGIAYIAIKAVPPYVENYELTDHLRDLAVRATVERMSGDSVTQDVLEYAHNLGLPVTAADVKVTSTGGMVKIELDYRVPIDLKFYTLFLHFTPAAENRAL
jgi:hypothetical protein